MKWPSARTWQVPEGGSEMCGIAGELRASGFVPEDDRYLHAMGAAIAHRGPDDKGIWLDRDQGIGLVHRRLAIVDLSPAGHQPMMSASERYVIAFNGEIYNHLDLRKELEGAGESPSWRGRSDTETLLAAIDAWGLQKALDRCTGMFALALWDRAELQLTLARDRLGEKPLYYGWQGQGDQAVFLFGSELKALRAHPAFRALISRQAIALFLRHNYIPAPYSIYEGIFKLQPGSLLSISLSRPDPVVSRYWSAPEIIRKASIERARVWESDRAIDELERILKSAVAQQMVADVPLGAFLSGGVDSSCIVALMQAQSSRPVKTFSIGFHEAAYNEAEHAKAVARHMGTDHTTLYVTAEEARAVIPRLPTIYDEPFADSSQIPTYLVSALARDQVAVALTGDGGDELFGGYGRYPATVEAWSRLSRLSMPLRRAVSRLALSLPAEAYSAITEWIPGKRFKNGFGERLHGWARGLVCESVDTLYHLAMSHWSNPAGLVIDGEEPPTLFKGMRPDFSGLDATERMMAIDLMTYLPDNNLVKVDRAAMVVSLETRVPMLDHRVVEFAWRLPLHLKRREGINKWILKQVLYRYVPQQLIERPKMGFGVPIADWLRGPLREWGEALLEESRLRRDGIFNPIPIRQKWADHQSGRRDWAYHLWDVLMFQAWREAQLA